MLLRSLARRPELAYLRLAQMTSHVSNGATNGHRTSTSTGCSLQDIPKSNVFTSNLPTDPEYKTPADSHKAPRGDLGPRMVKGALYTYVRPEKTKNSELLGVSKAAMKNIGLLEGVENTNDFKNLVAGNQIFWDEKTEQGIYPWAQCYGGNLSRLSPSCPLLILAQDGNSAPGLAN